MLTQRALDSIAPIVEQLKEQNIRLTPVASSVVETLHTESYSSLVDVEFQNAIANGRGVDSMEAARDSAQDDCRTHDEAMVEARDQVVRGVQAVLQFTRSIVLPHFRAIYDRYQELLDSSVIQAKNPINVIPNRYHSIWASESLEDLVSRYRNAPKDVYSTPIQFPELGYGELEKMAETGIASVDGQLRDLLNDTNSNLLQETYELYFQTPKAAFGVPSNAEHEVPLREGYYSSVRLTRNHVLLAYFIARGFEENMPDGMNVDLVELRNILSRMIQQGGRAVAREIDRRVNIQRYKNLVYRVNRPMNTVTIADEGSVAPTTIYVNHDVYRQFLEAGGTPETLYGGVVQGGSMKYEYLLENQEDLEKMWGKQHNLHIQQVSAMVYQEQREAMRLSLNEAIKNLDDGQLYAERSVLYQRVLDELGKVTPKAIDANDVQVLRTLVCRAVYNSTAAEDFTEAMDTAEQNFPDRSAREYAFAATVDYVAKWLGKQIHTGY